MNEMVARLRITVDVPFDYAMQGPDETGHAQSRIGAAQHAETNVTDRIRTLLAGYGSIVNVLIEEVRDSASGADANSTSSGDVA